jgi:lysozyme
MDKPSAIRLAVAAAVLSATALVNLMGDEGYTDKAIQPVPGDKPTYGFGSTVRADGESVRMGDRITPPAALALAARHIQMKEAELKTCFDGALLTQGEYDAFVSLAYNVGAGAVCRSSIPGKLKAGDYAAACKAILSFNKVQGRDCCQLANKRFCGGVCVRRQKEYRTCLKDSCSG